MDEFKKYLLAEKESLESDEPSEKVWSGIQASFEAPVKTMLISSWAIAASVILLVGLGILIFNKSNRTETQIVKSINQKIIPPVIEEKDSIVHKVETTLAAAVDKKNQSKQKYYLAASPITTIHSVNELNVADQSKMKLMEASFTQIINLQKARISTTPIYAESPNYFKDFHVQLQQMEKDETKIKIYIQKNGMSDELLDQLINVYQQKLNMLKLLQTEMQKLNSRYKQNRPAIDTMKTYFLNL
jgi:hypothetical protein